MWGGARAAVAARTFLAELGCSSVSATMQVPQAWKAFEEKEGIPELKNQMPRKSCTRMIDQLEWYAYALRNHREAEGLPV
jgi:hypothetical protein